MCGISGIVCTGDKYKIEKPIFEEMTDIMTHRGPDGRGTWYNNDIALGHRRLSIIDLSDDGIQPMHYLERYTIVFNGEIYNYIELKKELTQFGYRFRSKTDTEVIMAAYDKWGYECLNKFNGMWAFALFDQKEEELFCARDRFGVKPFYYSYDNEKFIFASEIKAILFASQSRPKANVERLLENICYSMFDHTSETMFANTMQLRAGHYLRLNLKKFSLQIEQYYDIKAIKQNEAKYVDNVAKFRELFFDSVKLRMRSDVTVGSCLSGGLDSSAIVCTTAKLLKNDSNRHETISSCYDKEDEKIYDEQEYIDEVTLATGTYAHKIYPEFEDFFSIFEKAIYHQDEPIGGMGHAAQHNVFKAARKYNLTVMLDGQGADEQLAGYPPFYAVIIRDYIRKFKFISATREIIAYIVLRNRYERRGIMTLIYPLFRDVIPTPLRQFIRKKFNNAEGFTWLKSPLSSKAFKDRVKYRSFDEYSKKSMIYGLIELLHFEDRNSMAYSVEGRLPFLDYRLVELIVSLPPDQKLKNGITKRILRDAMDGVLPDKIRKRMSKLGFAVPSDLWIQQNPEYINKELNESLDNLAPIIDKDKFLKRYKLNDNPHIIYNDRIIWNVISAGKWVKIFNVDLT